ncbi:diguanylate cyclase/phosphodiesterase with PAS/PAC sensor(s) [Rhizobium sp. CF080]|uniref:bifunctional diguanylate cyclase/phosphodiesterase n=1 Tax=Rhizobium sp. (strain CF080) TaxID=1144310 RepID=UPI0003E7E7C6|nr:EAL domain-containing protein [Rhizobium sp. CF080]EUC01301.1 diguanylate cyclase/phosphodiesterase with PAS/PAC sensor(s) [Rhizobium sp. CF080]
MKFWPSSGSKSLRLVRSTKTPTAFALVIALTVITIGVIVDQRNTEGFRSELRATTEKVGSMLVRRLVGRVETDIATSDHLVHILREDARDSLHVFEHYVDREFSGAAHFSGVAVAPDFELAHLITRDGVISGASGAVGGIDLARLANDLKSVSGRNRLSLLSGAQEGHLTLVMPVPKEEDGADLWGAIAVLIDKQDLMEASGVTFSPATAKKPNLINLDWLNVVLRDADRPEYFAFFGNDSIEEQSPMKWTVPVKGASWTMLAAPRSGWDVMPPDQLQFRLLIVLVGLAVIVPVFIATSLISERNRNINVLKARELNLIELSQRFNLAMEASNIGIWEVTGNSSSLFWDNRAAGLHDKPAASEGNRLYDWLGSIYPPDRTAAETHFVDCASANTPCSETYRVQLPDGTLRYLRSAGANYRNADGSLRTTGIVWDVTGDMVMTQTLRNAKENTDIKNAELELALDELSNREQQLEELSTKLDLALDSYNCGIWESNPVTHIETWDARMCQLHGVPFTDGHIRAEDWIELIHPDDREHAKLSSYHFTENFLPEPLVVRVPQPDGSIRYIRSTGKVHTTRDGSKKVVGIAFDVTQDAILTRELKAAKDEADAKNAELEIAKSRIEHNSLHDPLTLLANRRKLDMELDRLSRSSHNERQKFSILHLDLDRFKQINDTLGHAAGDAMLVHASRILSRNVRSSDIVARIGGDEFVILATDNSSAEQIGQLAQRIIAEFHQPIDFEGFACRCGVSIGIAQASGMNVDARRTLVNADIALYRAKGMGRNRYEFFTQNLQAEIVSHKRTADEVLAGIDNDEFITFYQPQFDARTNQLTGVEALIRWNHPHHGILAPDRFLKIAEDLNVSAALDHIVLQTVLKDKMRWAALGVRIPKVSVNVSSKRLHDETLIDTLQSLAIVPGEISFELVESIFLDESEASATGNLERIKELGIDIEIDDFGTGHTSIVSLLKLKPKRLKIDRQLVMPILTSPQERALVRSIIDIARSLGVETVAEGVETMQHASLLRELGCDLLQGYAFARPLSFNDFTEAAHAGWRKAA